MRASLIAVGLVMHVGVASADVELKNDGFNSGDSALAQGGFVAGEIAASRFVAPDAGRTLLKVQLIYGGAAGTRTVDLHVYDDTAGTDSVGSAIYVAQFSLTASDAAIQELATTDMTVTLPAQFRVGIVFGDGCPSPPASCGLPSITRDNDGTIAADKNYIFAIPGGWIKSQAGGLQGDWIIRAFISGTGGPGPGPDGGNPTGGACDGNGDCPVGEFCDTTAGACTFECRTDPDCGDNSTCNSLGQCVLDLGGGGGGCCRTDRGGTDIGALVLGGLFGMMLLRRRRRCA